MTHTFRFKRGATGTITAYGQGIRMEVSEQDLASWLFRLQRGEVKIPSRDGREIEADWRQIIVVLKGRL
jgi:hypothetical protein